MHELETNVRRARNEDDEELRFRNLNGKNEYECVPAAGICSYPTTHPFQFSRTIITAV